MRGVIQMMNESGCWGFVVKSRSELEQAIKFMVCKVA